MATKEKAYKKNIAARKEQSAKLAAKYGSGEKDGSLAVQIAVVTAKVKELAAKKDKTSANRLALAKRNLNNLIGNYRRINKEAAVALEKSLK
ncbi:MAG: hypothetical protein FWE37_07140 [Spirochaetaceae bacterium]|nr:hypothetical protein [Spirochaetaceae bacterium]